MIRCITHFLGLCLSAYALAETPPFDAATSIALDGEFTDIRLVTAETDDALIRDEMTAQLFYSVGALNTFNSGGDLGHAQVVVWSKKPIARGLTEIRYSVKLMVGWDKSIATPPGVRIAFPASTDIAGRKRFFAAYGKACSEDPGADADSLYYYFRPEKQGCPLALGKEPPEAVSYALLALRPSASQTSGKYPEYDKIWEDGKLVATAIFGTYTAGATNHNDSGVWAYNQAYLRLNQAFGSPSYVNHKLGLKKVPGARIPDMQMRWDLNDGKSIDVQLLLIDKEGLQHPTPAFQRRYNERTRTSDFVSYNGHSGYGDNIRALAKLGTFLPKRYQIYFVNGCDTFFYVDDSLRLAHAAVNPGSKPYEFFDVITNAMPTPFAQMAIQNVEILSALSKAKATYREILMQFHPFQKAIVLGEEDNVFHP